ncbi:MAG: nucleotide 5'-monophosphate nucleosidase PpnN, partial [Wenzhouxiangellaceae bacterium]
MIGPTIDKNKPARQGADPDQQDGIREYMNHTSMTAQSGKTQTHSTRVYPAGSLNILSREEVTRLSDASEEVGDLLRRCALAVLNSGEAGDDAEAMLQRYSDFTIRVNQVNRGIRLELENAPGSAFVDGEIIYGIRELLSAVVRDIVYFHTEIRPNPYFDQESSEGISNTVFEILRNGRLLHADSDPNLVICWGGHSIPDHEYDYSKDVGYQLGLRGCNIGTGCGPGAMKGPMKGATIGHAKQRIRRGRYIGITEPGITAAESPNPIVNSLVIMPDMEKRLEAFVRVGHGIVIFPGGVGTAEEILYLLGILLHPANATLPFPVIMTGPPASEPYFRQIDEFISAILGPEAEQRYSIIIDDPEEVARKMLRSLEDVREFRFEHGDAYYFNWRLAIDHDFQKPFSANHESMASLDLNENLPVHILAANLRRAFSGIVSGNVREDTI